MAEAVILTLGLGLSLMGVPGLPDAGLDGSWQEMLVHAHGAGLQFGRDIIFTWGPWGYLCTRYHLGAEGAVPILVWQTAGQLLIAFCLVNLTWSLSVGRRILFVVTLLVIHWLFQDTVYFLLIALAGVGPLMNRDAKVVRLILWAVLLGFLAQLKFTYFVISGAAVVASAACQAARGSKRQASAIIGAYAASVVGAWVAAGQNIDNLYPYIRRSLEIASGYGDAMGLDESWTVFWWGTAIAVICLAFCRNAWRSIRDRHQGRAASVLLFFILFVMWKEAFTRADYLVLGGHIFGFIGLVAILLPATTGTLLGARGVRGFDATILICALAVGFIDPGYYSLVLRVEWQRIYGNVLVLGRLEHQPQDWEEQLSLGSAKVALPAIKAAVGSRSIDTYNYPEGAALLNGLALSARPIFQSYSAYTPGLEGWNLRYFQSNKAPDFLLWHDGRVDNRYPGEDDAMLVQALPGHYSPVLSESGYWLFRRGEPVPTTSPEHRLLSKERIQLGESVDIPAAVHEAIWLEADAVPNALGRARAILYKPAQIDIVTTDDVGQERSWRLLPRVAKAGFLLVPTLETGADLVELMNGGARSWVRKIRFAAPGDQDEFWSHIDVRVLAVPSLPLSALPNSRLIELGIFDRRPKSIEAAVDLEVVDIPEGKALQLHAPGSIAFDYPKSGGLFSGMFGIRQGAYTGAGHTAGVEFKVDAIWATGRTQTIWKRFLDPVANPPDRGSQTFQVQIPPDGATRLVFSTSPGPTRDNRWDWSYVRDLKFGTGEAR